MAIKDLYYTISEAAKELNVSRQTIYRWIADDKIPTEKIGGVILVEKGAINKHAAKRFMESMSQLFDGLAFDALRQELGYTDEDIIERAKNERDYLVFLVTRKNGTREKVLVGGSEITMASDRKQKTPVFSGMKLKEITRTDYKEPKSKKGRKKNN